VCRHLIHNHGLLQKSPRFRRKLKPIVYILARFSTLILAILGKSVGKCKFHPLASQKFLPIRQGIIANFYLLLNKICYFHDCELSADTP
jgi:hypothetical protein